MPGKRVSRQFQPSDKARNTLKPPIDLAAAHTPVYSKFDGMSGETTILFPAAPVKTCHGSPKAREIRRVSFGAEALNHRE
jgi:hypothetical protein